MLHSVGVSHQWHYLDDFVILGRPGADECTNSLGTVIQLCAQGGIPIAHAKTEGPASTISFLGIVIDSELGQLRLPADKLVRLRGMISEWVLRKRCTRKDLERLVGHLSHAATVMKPGRSFLRSLFNLLKGSRAAHHFVFLNKAARADLKWWFYFLQVWFGSFFFVAPVPSHHVYSDASGSWGCGAVQDASSWFQVRWPGDGRWESASIATMELVPLVVAAAIWGPTWGGQHIRFHCDNMSVVAMVNSGTSKEESLMDLLRCFYLYAACYRFHYDVVHIPGVDNTVADALSRNKLSVFTSIFPQGPSLVPSAVLDLVVFRQPQWGSQDWTDSFVSTLGGVSHLLRQAHTGQPNHNI